MIDAFGLTPEQSDPWKFGGWESLTHQEALRRQARAELLALIRKREVTGVADVLDGMAKRPAPWSDPDADPIGDMRALGEASRAAWPWFSPTVWPEGAQDLADRLTADVARVSAEMARRRDEQLAPYIEALQTLRESGREVWLEETPPRFETEGVDGDRQVWRITSTARIRYTGDGLDEARP